MSILALIRRAPTRPRLSAQIPAADTAPALPSLLIDLGPWSSEADMSPRTAGEWMALAAAGGVRRSSVHVAYCGS